MFMFHNDLLKDKVIVITGGGTGLGRAIGERYLQLGAKLAIASRRIEVLQEAAQEMTKDGGEVFYKSCDVRDPSEVVKLFDAIFAHYGKIDVLVNNAAGNFISPTERLSSRAVDSILNIVLHGTFYCTLELGKRWIQENQSGTMLNIVTTYAASGAGSGYVVPSAAAKAGVLSLTRSLAVEWAKYGIRQVAIAPGMFPTEGAWSRLVPSADIGDRLLQRVPLQRTGNKSELANLAAFLVSDEAAYINGEVVTIDGGEWLQGAGEFNELIDLSAEDWDHLSAIMRQK